MKKEDILNTLTENIDNAKIGYWKYEIWEQSVYFTTWEWVILHLKVGKIHFKIKCSVHRNKQTIIVKEGLFNRVRLTQKDMPIIGKKIQNLIYRTYNERIIKKSTELHKRHCERRQKKINKGINKLRLIDGS